MWTNRGRATVYLTGPSSFNWTCSSGGCKCLLLAHWNITISISLEFKRKYLLPFHHIIVLNMYSAFIRLELIESLSAVFPSSWCCGCAVWGRSSLFLLSAVFQIISETQLKSLHFAVLICHHFLPVVCRRVCLRANRSATVRVALVLVHPTQGREGRLHLSVFFLSRKWSSLHKGLVNPFKYALQTLKCVMLTATLVTYNVFSLNRCLQKLLHQVTWAAVLRGFVCEKYDFKSSLRLFLTHN